MPRPDEDIGEIVSEPVLLGSDHQVLISDDVESRLHIIIRLSSVLKAARLLIPICVDPLATSRLLDS